MTVSRLRTLLLFSLIFTIVLIAQADVDKSVQAENKGASKYMQSYNCGAAAGISFGDCQVLVTIYNEMGGNNWKNQTWLQSNTPCAGSPPGRWFGVECANSRVVALRLQDFDMSGQIPEEIGNLARLDALYLNRNNIGGTIPSEIGQLGNLRELNLGSNNIGGSIPSSLGNLSDLQSLFLNRNELVGELPTSLGQLGNLKTIGIASNYFSGNIPAQWSGMSSLQKLGIGLNALGGDVPGSIISLPSITEVDIIYSGFYATNNDVNNWLIRYDPDWEDTQTVAPTNLRVTLRSNDVAVLEWTPIKYMAHGGYYEISYSTSSGVRSQTVTTSSKLADSITISGLQPSTRYYFAIRTYTPPHLGEVQKNGIFSNYSGEISDGNFVATDTPTSAPTSTSTSTPTSTFVPTSTSTSIPTSTPTPVNVDSTSAPPTMTFTLTPMPTDTPFTPVPPTGTPLPTPTLPNITPTAEILERPAKNYLAFVVLDLQQVPTPQLEWRRVGQGGLTLSALATTGETLFAADRSDPTKTGGLYQRSLQGCQEASSLARIGTVSTPVLDVAMLGNIGLAAGFGGGIIYSNNSGASWTTVGANLNDVNSVLIPGASGLLAGTENDGIFISPNSGASWSSFSSEPKKINVLRQKQGTNMLWIGTSDNGVWRLQGVGALQERNVGLNTLMSKRVWDVVFASEDIYLATLDGVYQTRGDSPWQSFGLQGSRVRALEIFGNYLYAGLLKGGVWRRSLLSGTWEPVYYSTWDSKISVRDLHYDAYCGGLFAATDDGLWLYR